MTNQKGRFGIHGGQYVPETLMNRGKLALAKDCGYECVCKAAITRY